MALVQWARGGRARQVWIHYCGIGANQAAVLGGEAAADESGVAMVPIDVAERGVITNEVFGAVLRSLPEDSACFVVLDCCHAGSMVDLPFVCDRDKGARKALTAPPPAVRIHLLASSRDHSSDAQARSLVITPAPTSILTLIEPQLEPNPNSNRTLTRTEP